MTLALGFGEKVAELHTFGQLAHLSLSASRLHPLFLVLEGCFAAGQPVVGLSATDKRQEAIQYEPAGRLELKLPEGVGASAETIGLCVQAA